MDSASIIVLSIHPVHGMNILKGDKKVELRRIQPKYLSPGSLVLLYASSPLKSLIGAFRVSSITKKPILELWEEVEDKACITLEEFNNYYSDIDSGIAIYFDETWEFPSPINLDILRDEMDFQPPQSFRYATSDDMQLLQHSNISFDLDLL